MAPRRRYTVNERAAAVAAVAANNGSVHGTAKILGVPETSLRQWCNGQRHPELLPLSERYKRELADKLARFADLALGVALKKVNELSAYQAVICASIALDKWLLLTEEKPPPRRKRGRGQWSWPPPEQGETHAQPKWACLSETPSCPPEPTEKDYAAARRILAERQVAGEGEG